MLIFIKLNIGETLFRDERLGILLEEDNIPVAQFDYANINVGVIEALNAGIIIQISETEYWEIKNALDPMDSGDHTSCIDLLNIKEYWKTCPPDDSVLILIYERNFYKILWSKVKECLSLGGGGVAKLTIRMGQFECPINEGDTTFVKPEWIGKNVRLFVNGIKQYTYAEWALSTDPDLESNTDYTNYDINTGTFSRPSGFKSPELLEFI